MRLTKHPYFALAALSLFLTLAYLCPIHTHPLRVFYPNALAVVGLIVCAVYFALGSQVRWHMPLLLAVPLFIMGLIGVQLGLGMVTFSDVALALLSFVVVMAAVIVGASIASHRDDLAGASGRLAGAQGLCLALAVGHLLAGLISVALMHVQIFGVDMTPVVMYVPTGGTLARVYANVAQPNQLALLLCLALGSTWYLFQRGLLNAVAGALLVAALVWGLTLTQSRIGWFILPLFALIFVWQTGFKGEYEKRVSWWFLLGVLVLYAACIAALPEFAQLIGLKGGSVEERIGGRSERSVLFAQAIRLALDHPWLGMGWMGFGKGQVDVAADFSSTVYAEHSHNLMLNLASELGLPAVVLIVGALAFWFWHACVRAEKSLPVRFATLCFIAIGVHSMVEFPLWYTYVLLPFALLMGMVHQLRWASSGIRVRPVAVWGVGVAAFVVLGLVTADFQRLRTGFLTLRADDPRPQATTTLPSVTLMGSYYNYFKFMKLEPREGMSVEEIDFVERTSRRFGFIHILNKRAEVYVLNGRPQDATRTLLTMQRLDTYNYRNYFDYWKKKGAGDARFQAVFLSMPARDAE
jgi:O-antigen ligase